MVLLKEFLWGISGITCWDGGDDSGSVDSPDVERLLAVLFANEFLLLLGFLVEDDLFRPGREPCVGVTVEAIPKPEEDGMAPLTVPGTVTLPP